MPSENDRAFRAQCEQCRFRSPRWTTSFIAHVEAVGHHDQSGHETFVKESDRGRHVA